MAATSDLALSLEFIEQRFADELRDLDRHHHSVQQMLDHLDDADSTGASGDHTHSQQAPR